MILEIEYEQALQGIGPTLEAVAHEREKQLKKWGTQDHDPKMWLAILGEEYGEVCKEVAETHVKDFDRDAYRKECLHTAAVALAMVQCIDDGIA
jgi:hypothetical protein